MLIKSMYNLPSIEKFADSASKQGFCDAFTGTVLERNLIHVDPTILEQQYPELAFVNSGITANNTGGYVKKIQTLRKRSTGEFVDAKDRSANKGRIDMALDDTYLTVTERAAFSEWSDSDLKEAQLQGINLAQDYIKYHSEIYQREIDSIGLLGKGGTNGLLNHGDFGTAAATALIGAGNALADYEIVANELIATQWNSVNNMPAYRANVVIMPIAVQNHLVATIFDTTSGNSIMKQLETNFPSIRFMTSFRADTQMVAFSTTTNSMVMRLPIPLTVGEIIKRSSFHYKVDSLYRIAGLDVLEGAGGYILTAVAS